MFYFGYNYFSQLFRAKTGKNYKKFVLEAKMTRAMQLLLSGWSDRTVAQALGYSNEKNFSRAFKQFAGNPPGKWKSRHGMETIG